MFLTSEGVKYNPKTMGYLHSTQILKILNLYSNIEALKDNIYEKVINLIRVQHCNCISLAEKNYP